MCGAAGGPMEWPDASHWTPREIGRNAAAARLGGAYWGGGDRERGKRRERHGDGDGARQCIRCMRAGNVAVFGLCLDVQTLLRQATTCVCFVAMILVTGVPTLASLHVGGQEPGSTQAGSHALSRCLCRVVLARSCLYLYKEPVPHCTQVTARTHHGTHLHTPLPFSIQMQESKIIPIIVDVYDIHLLVSLIVQL